MPGTGVVFETDRLCCRRWVASDLGALLAVYSDPEVMRWVGDGRPITRSECEAWLQVNAANYRKRGYGMFALEETVTGELIGFCGLVHPDAQELPEIKYALKPSHWRQGLASEAVPALLTYGATQHSLSRIIATVASENLVSQRILTNVGMRLADRRSNRDGSTTLVFEWRAPKTDSPR